jgi:serine/threonine protein kinase
VAVTTEDRTDGAPIARTLREGRYVIVGLLGRGGQATTWDATDRADGRAVAIKQFDVGGARTWKDLELAEREARVLSELSHPLLPRYVEHFDEGGALYLVIEKIEGAPLSVVKQQGGLDEASVLRLLEDAGSALSYLHGRSPPVVHRDLKPSNVIRRPDGSYAFIDFGAVRDRLRPEGGSTVVGTFGYMAPEQFQGRAEPRSDVYAIGATALALLTEKDPEALPHRGLALDVAAALEGRASAELAWVLAKMVDPDPDRRPELIASVLEAMRNGEARGAPSAPARRGEGTPARVVVPLVVLAIVAALSAAIVHVHRAPSRAPAAASPSATPAPQACPELQALSPELTALSVEELEDRMRKGGLVQPSALERQIQGMEKAVAAYAPENRACALRAMLVQSVAAIPEMAKRPGMWGRDRSSDELAKLYRTTPLRSGYTLAQRDDMLAQVDERFVANLKVEAPGDAEFWRRMYYALLLTCDATDAALAELGAPRGKDCVDLHPR